MCVKNLARASFFNTLFIVLYVDNKRFLVYWCERLGLVQILSAVYLENIAWDEIEKLFTPICISQVLLAYQLAWLRPLDL